jgi:hypothetical protein
MEIINRHRKVIVRMAAALAVAMLILFGYYELLVSLAGGYVTSILAGVGFLCVLPAVASGCICFFIDPYGNKPLGFYLIAPVLLVYVSIMLAAIFLGEGAICIFMLALPWLIFGGLGAIMVYGLRKRYKESDKRNDVFRTSLLSVGLAYLALEQQIPAQKQDFEVTRTVVIKASASEIWEKMVSIPNISDSEGQSNFTQTIMGVPSPRESLLVKTNTGYERQALWGDDIRFIEKITKMENNKELSWDFQFTQKDFWHFPDTHLYPDTPVMKIKKGSYIITPIDKNTNRLTLNAEYTAQTKFNGYAWLWGEIIIGDIEGDCLAIIKNRAEKHI